MGRWSQFYTLPTPATGGLGIEGRMSNVIGFPPRDPEQAKSDEVRLAALSARADALRTMLMTNKTIPPADQMTVAEALWRLLARLQERGISKTKILETAGVARRHLGQYARNPDRRTDERGTTRPLTKKPRPYLKIIEAAATEAGMVEPAKIHWICLMGAPRSS
jgi:hypothetical protein